MSCSWNWSRRAVGLTICFRVALEVLAGNNAYAQLGDGTARNTALPVDVPGNFSHVSAGMYHSCGLRSSGTIACWGEIQGSLAHA